MSGGLDSKKEYASGIADLVQALSNWSSSKHVRRKGRKVGFPRFKSKRKDTKVPHRFKHLFWNVDLAELNTRDHGAAYI